MKTLLNMIFLPAGTEERYGRAHQIWLAVTLTGLGCCIGLLSLVFSAVAVDSLSSRNLLLSYVTDPLILFLNLWPPVLLVWLFYFLFRRAWIGFLGGFLPIIGVALVNYYKIQLRADPFLAVDLNLASEAAGIVGKYELELNWLIWLTLAALLAGLVFAVLLMPRGLRGWQGRMLGALSAGMRGKPFFHIISVAAVEFVVFCQKYVDIIVFIHIFILIKKDGLKTAL